MTDASERRAVEGLLAAVAGWARTRGDVRAVALVGSRARGAARPESDVDLMVLVTDPTRYLETGRWAESLGIRLEDGREAWGAVASRRGFTESGLEIELGFATTAWAATDPPDAGTLCVVRDGIKVVYDPDGLLAKLMS